MRCQIRTLKEEKKKLIAQLIDCDMLRKENERLRQVLREERRK
jgi:cell shape-determining protein MreC